MMVAGAFMIGTGSTADAATHVVEINGFKFQPAAVSAAPGDTITFVNRDAAPHTATATDGSFDTGTLRSGASVSVTVSQAGQHPFTCRFHPSMRGTVSVK